MDFSLFVTDLYNLHSFVYFKIFTQTFSKQMRVLLRFLFRLNFVLDLFGKQSVNVKHMHVI